MISFDITAEQRLLRETLFDLGRELNDGLIERDEAGEFFMEGWRRCGEVGLQGLPLPEEYGGAGADMMTCALALEAFGRGCRDEGLIFSICAHMQSAAIPIAAKGSDEQKAEFLPKLADGSWISGNATTEPDSGSDAYAMETRAVRDGDEYVLNGRKTFCTNGPIADAILIYALTNPDYRQFGGVSGFFVPRDAPGLEIGPNMKKIGLRTSPWCELWLDDCRVPASRRIAQEGSGGDLFQLSMDWERLLLSMAYVGRMQDTLDRTIEYARSRRQFGKTIGKHQAVASKIVEMKGHLEASRLLLYKAAWERDRGKSAALEIALAKWWTTESRIQSSLHAIQIHGGYGCAVDMEIERELRNAVPATIASGTSEIQKMIVARRLRL